ncbi:MAG: TonB-dependent receptor, partial [Steroidobacteraceae bacterium]
MRRHPVVSVTVLSLCGTFTSAFAADPLDTVTITASPIGDGDSLATLVESVDRATLLESGAASLGDALSSVPGVTGSGFAPGASRPIIRGYDSSRVRVLENGLGSFDVADVGPDHGVPIDPLGADRIEILRGPGTLRFGSQAIGGVVNTLNQRVPTRLPAEPFGGEVALGGSTAADGREASGQLHGVVGDWALHADGFRRKLDDYRSPAGTEAGTFWDGKGGSLGASRIFTQGNAGAAIVHYDANYGLPGEDALIDLRQNKVLTRAAFEPDGSAIERLTFDAGYGDYRHAEKDPDGTEHAVFEDEEWEGRFEASFGAVGFLSASAVGAQFQHRDYSALGEAEDYLLPTRTRSAAAFAFAESELNARTRLQYGLRVERTEVKGTDISDASRDLRFTPVSGAIGGVFDAAPDLQLGLTASSSGRAPAQTELFARGPHDGPRTFERGNSSLGIERANSLEGTLHWRRDGTHVEAAVWQSWHEGFIHGDFTGRNCDEAGDCVAGSDEELRELVYGASDARFRGFEFEWEQRLATFGGGELSGRLTGDLVRARFEDGTDVPRI